MFALSDLKMSFHKEQILLMRCIYIKEIILKGETTTLKGTIHPTIKSHSFIYSPLLKIEFKKTQINKTQRLLCLNTEIQI